MKRLGKLECALEGDGEVVWRKLPKKKNLCRYAGGADFEDGVKESFPTQIWMGGSQNLLWSYKQADERKWEATGEAEIEVWFSHVSICLGRAQTSKSYDQKSYKIVNEENQLEESNR